MISQAQVFITSLRQIIQAIAWQEMWSRGEFNEANELDIVDVFAFEFDDLNVNFDLCS